MSHNKGNGVINIRKRLQVKMRVLKVRGQVQITATYINQTYIIYCI